MSCTLFVKNPGCRSMLISSEYNHFEIILPPYIHLQLPDFCSSVSSGWNIDISKINVPVLETECQVYNESWLKYLE